MKEFAVWICDSVCDHASGPICLYILLCHCRTRRHRKYKGEQYKQAYALTPKDVFSVNLYIFQCYVPYLSYNGSYRWLPDKADRCLLQARYRAICIDTYYIIMMQSHLYWYLLHHYDAEPFVLVLTSLWYRAICISTYIIMIQYYLLLPCASYYLCILL